MAARLIQRVLLAVLSVAWLAGTGPAGAQTATDDVPQVMARTIDDVIRPGYARFAESARALETSTEALCATPSDETLAAARNAFGNVIAGWGGVEFIRFGPVMSENRLERILFWPDRKSIGLKQVQAILVEEDATATDPATLKKKSVAMQGLGALEFVLFGTGSDELASKSGYRCDYADAIAANLSAISDELVKDWADPQGAAAFWTGGGQGDQVPDDKITETLNQLVSTLVHGLEAVRDTRLRPFVDIEGKSDKPRRAIFWRSRQTIPLLHADIEGLAHFFDGSHMERLLPEDVASIADSVRFEFRQAADLLQDDGQPVDELLADDKARGRLVLLDIIIGSLIERIDTQYAPAAGLSSGFSFADGD